MACLEQPTYNWTCRGRFRPEKPYCLGTLIPVFLLQRISKALALNRQGKLLISFVEVDVTASEPDPLNNQMPQGKLDPREWTGAG